MANRGPGRDRNDYGTIRRANRRRQRQENPGWIREKLTPGRLGMGITIAAMCAVFGGKVYDSLYGNGQKALAELGEVINGPEKNEKVEKSDIVPEDERSGKNLLVAAHPLNQLMYERGYRKYFEETFTTMFNLLPKGTNIHLAVPEASREEALKVAKEMYPHLNFIAYDMPTTDAGIEYAQDTFFATGGFDENGRVILATSALDDEYLNKGLMAQAENTLSYARLWPFHLDNVRASYGVLSFGDELLAKRYPDKFVARDVPVRTEGGDMHISRTPDGKIILVVGRKNLTETAVFKDPNLTKDRGVYFGLTGPNFVLERLEEIRILYQKAFGVDKVVFLGEDFLYTLAREEYDRRRELEGDYLGYEGRPSYDRMVDQESAVPVMSSFFFHLDMALKTVTTSSGESVAFCTDYTEEQAMEYADMLISESMGEDAPREYKERLKNAVREEVAFLRTVQRQFHDLGYKVVKLPCGLYPALNYTNSVVFKGEGGEKIAIVPQYGIPEDRQALEAYESLGFKILASDYTDLIDVTVEDSKSQTGRVLEELGVKNVSTGLKGIGSYHCRTVVLGEPEEAKPHGKVEKPGKRQPDYDGKIKSPQPPHKKSPKKGSMSKPKNQYSPQKGKDFQRRKI